MYVCYSGEAGFRGGGIAGELLLPHCQANLGILGGGRMAADEYNGSPDEAIFEITHARSGFQRKWRRRLAQRTDSADVVHSTLMEKTMDIRVQAASAS